MRRSFLKGAAISLAAYAGAVALGFLVDFRLTLFGILALQVTWTLFCAIRGIQLRIAGAHRREAPLYDREDYGFAIGGLTCSAVMLLVMVVWSQVV